MPQGAGWPALADWSRELRASPATTNIPWHEGLLIEALVAGGRRALAGPARQRRWRPPLRYTGPMSESPASTRRRRPGTPALPTRRRRTPRARPSVIQLVFREKGALYAAYIPLFTDGGLFVPTTRDYRLGDDIYLLLSLPDDPQRYPVAGKVAWITPANASGGRTQGVGVRFPERREVAPAQDQDRGNARHDASRRPSRRRRSERTPAAAAPEHPRRLTPTRRCTSIPTAT